MTQLNMIEVAENGTLFIRFLKDDGGWHRTSIPPDTDPDKQMASVNEHLVQMGQGAVALVERTAIKSAAVIAHTPAVKQRYEEEKERLRERIGQIGSPVGLLASAAGAATPASTAKDSGVGSRTGSSEKEG